jgi:hypothetical protein
MSEVAFAQAIRGMIWGRLSARLGLALMVLATLAIYAPSASADVKPFEVKAYAQELDVPSAVAEDYLEVQATGAQADIRGALEDGLQENFAGVWFDTASGEYVVPMASSAAGPVAGKELATARLAGDSRTRVVEYSWEDLEAAQDQLDPKLREFFKAALVYTSIDPHANAVVLHVAAAASAKDRADLRRIAKSVGDQVELREGDDDLFQGELDACNDLVPSCGNPLRGGVEIGPPNTFGGTCTAGFRAIGKTNGQRYLLTAGHCVAGHPGSLVMQWQSRDEQKLPQYFQGKYMGINFGQEKFLGEVEQFEFPVHDWVKINVTGSEWDIPLKDWPSLVAYWSKGTGIAGQPPIAPEYPINGEAASVKGQGVCHSGIASGGTCGQVVETNVSYDFEQDGIWTKDLVKVKGACGESGDSGGPWFASNIAYGLHTGTEGDLSACGAPTFYEDITVVTAALDVTVGPAPPPPGPPAIPPTVQTTAATNIQEEQATLNGTVNPNGSETTYYFEYGKTTAYGKRLPVGPSAGAGAGTQAVPMYLPVALQPRTQYHYRIVAGNAAGTSYGSDQSFTTGLRWSIRNSNSAGNPDAAFWFGLPGEKRVSGDWDGNGTTTPGTYNPTTGVWKLRNYNTTGKAEVEFQYGGGVWSEPITGDWNGDGKTTIGVFDPSAGNWNLRNSNSAGPPDAASFQYGGSQFKPVSGDWNGDGKTTIGLFEPSAGSWQLRNTNSGGAPDLNFQYGGSQFKPVSGDWNGDGKTTIGLYETSGGNWQLRNTNSAGPPDLNFQHGGSQFTPVTGDWDASGTETPGLADPSAGTIVQWQLRNHNGFGSDVSLGYGQPSEKRVSGDWDGNGTTTPGTYNPTTGVWKLRNLNTSGSAEIEFQFGGGVWSEPITGDWNGDGKTTIGVFDPSAGNWNLRNSNSAGPPDAASFQYGGSQFKPITGDWNGDGKTTIGLYETSGGNWQLRNTNSGGAPDLNFQYGGSQFKPVTGDWNGDKTTTIGLYETSGGNWQLRNSNSGGAPDVLFQFGGSQYTPLSGDWDADGIETPGLANPNVGPVIDWQLRNSNSALIPDTVFEFAAFGAREVTGDWDGNGTTTTGTYDPVTGVWKLRNSNTTGFTDVEFQYGGGIWSEPITGDWDGNGTTTIGVYDPSAGNWRLRNSNSAGAPNTSFQYGGSQFKPVTGDWDGNKTTTIGLYETSGGNWQLRNTNSGGAPDLNFQYGGSQFKPVTGDWDGNKTTTIGLHEPISGSWQLRNSNSAGSPSIAFQFGGSQFIPLSGDWNADGVDTVGLGTG